MNNCSWYGKDQHKNTCHMYQERLFASLLLLWITTHAFLAAADYAIEADKDCIITDVDLLFRGNITTLFEEKEFDVAITDRDWPRPLSSGVWFCRNTPEAKKFIELWKLETLRLDAELGNNTRRERKMQKAHGGLDQASLASALKKNDFAKVLRVPCAIYNAEQSCWANMRDDCKCVHIASRLRRQCLGLPNEKKKLKKGQKKKKSRYPKGILDPMIKEWKSYL